jgi:hypothetical protein
VEEKDDPPEQLKNGNTEEWESKSVEIYDSVNAVAEGKEREWIEKWWTMREVQDIEHDIQQELDTAVEEN